MYSVLLHWRNIPSKVVTVAIRAAAYVVTMPQPGGAVRSWSVTGCATSFTFVEQ